MTSIRDFQFNDLFKFNRIVFDPLTEVYQLSFLMPKILEFPMLAKVAVSPSEQLMGFVLGYRAVLDEMVGDGKDQDGITSYGHISTLSVDHDFRCLGLGTLLMESVNACLERQRDWYVDLYVRSKNKKAIKFYELLGYVKYRWLSEYYSDGEDGYEMRLPLARDAKRNCLKGKDYMIDHSVGHKLMQLLFQFLMGCRNAIMQF